MMVEVLPSNSPQMHVRRVSAFVGLMLVLGGLMLTPSALAVSPGDDGEISYVNQPSGSRSDLFAMNSNGSERGNLTKTRRVAESTPAWSPSGVLLAFQALDGGVRRIFVRNVSTGVVQRVSSGPSADRFPTWSPDGSEIAYRSLRRRASGADLGAADIYVVPRAGGTRVKLTTMPGTNTDPTWSPDGTKIAFASNSDGNYDIYVMDADGANVVNLTNDGVGPPAVSNRFPSWSPDGMKIAYTSNRNNQNEEIYYLDVSGGFVAPPSVRLTTDPARDRSPAWSPSGSKVAFASNRGGTFNIWTMNAADGSGLDKLTSGTAKKTEPSWQSLAGCTIVGTNGANVLTGTPGADVICALGGNDTIRGRGGADRIFGGPGADVIRGGPSSDLIHAGRGNDTIHGDDGRDRILSGYGRDTLFARDRQRDRLDGGPARDRARIDRRLDQRKRIEAFF
jgi:Tol biopolymer transport system component